MHSDQSVKGRAAGFLLRMLPPSREQAERCFKVGAAQPHVERQADTHGRSIIAIDEDIDRAADGGGDGGGVGH
jgi:hypothetical protein